jgi:iron complex outermembrane receptor protein
MVSLALGAAPVAQAQTAQATTLEEIIVTAQRREERLQEVPVSVTALSAQEIESRGISATRDVLPAIPNMTYDESFTIGQSFVSVRGVAQISNADSPIAIVVDGVPQNSEKQLKMELFDIERIEVLKGPQGALYGRNAIGGALNIVTQRPTNEFSGAVNAGYASGETKSFSGSVSGPLVEDTDFYTSKDIRGRLLLTPADDLEIDLRASWSDLDGGAVMDASMPPGDPANDSAEVSPRSDILGRSERTIKDATAKIDWITGIGTLTSITGYTDLDEDYYGDLDFCNPVDCPAGFFGLGPQADQQQILGVKMLSQELRLTSPDDQPVRWIAGAFYINTERDLETIGNLLLPGFALPIITSSESNDNDAYSVFGQVDWDILPDTTLSTSLRYDEDQREQTDVSTGASRNKTFSATQPRIVLSHGFTDDQLGYVSYSTGFRSGGFNGIGGRPFKEELLDNLEAGWKSEWLDRRLRVNAAVFISRSEDYQFFYVDFNVGGAQVIDNLKEVEFTGGELEVQAQVAPGWQVYGTLGILDSEIKDIDPTLTVAAIKGNRTPRTQESNLSFGTEYEFPIGALTARLRVDYNRMGKRYWHPDNLDVRDPVNLLDLRASIGNDQWTVTAWGRNVTDEFYWQSFNSVRFGAPGVDLGSQSQPDTYGIDFKYAF